jgi:hypothetical protein
MITTFILILMAVIFDAAADAERDEENKPLSHVFEALSILSFLMLVFVYPGRTAQDFFVTVFGMYVVQRFMLFDMCYNAVRGIELDYIGNTSFVDRFWRWTHFPYFGIFWIRVIVWIGYTIGVLVNYKM